MRKSFFILFTILSIQTSYLLAQEKIEEVVLEEIPKNIITVNFGYTYIPQASSEEDETVDAHYVTTVGIDYLRRVHNRWEIGVIADVELDTYYMPEQEFFRENAFIFTGIALFNVTSRWNVLFGGGMEFEKNEHLVVARLGTEYAQPLPNEWFIPFSFIYDLKEEYNTWAISIGIGKEF